MEAYQLLARKAFNNFKAADHLTYVTLPLLKDTRLILTVLENLNLSLINGMNSILEYERLYRRISALPENLDLRLDVFKIVGKRYNVTEEELNLIRSSKKILEILGVSY